MDEPTNARREQETRAAALWRRVDASHVRRGAQFLINIGVPLLVGVLRGESQIALAAVIVGMAFGFADSAGSFSSRLRFLALDAFCIGVGAVLGYLARSHAALSLVFRWPHIGCGPGAADWPDAAPHRQACGDGIHCRGGFAGD